MSYTHDRTECAEVDAGVVELERELAQARALLARWDIATHGWADGENVHVAFHGSIEGYLVNKDTRAFLARQAPEPAPEDIGTYPEDLPLPWAPPEPPACTCPIKPEGSAFWAHVPSCPAAGRGEGDR